MLALEAALIDHSRVLGLVLVSAIPGTNASVAAHNEALAADIEGPWNPHRCRRIRRQTLLARTAFAQS